MWYYKKIFVLLLTLSMFSSCGFKPVYNYSAGKKEITGVLKIPELPGMQGYHLREELIKRLGTPKENAYFLVLDVTTNKINEVITPNNEITSYRLIMRAIYSVKDKNGTTVLQNQISEVRTGFSSASNSTGYTTQIAEEAAKKRLAIKIGNKIATRLAILSEKWLL